MNLFSTISRVAISAAQLTNRHGAAFLSQGGYWVRKDGVYFYSGFPNGAVHLVEGADPVTFKPLVNECVATQADRHYGIDKGHVYYVGKMIKGADPRSFRVIGNGLSQDMCAIYWECELLSNRPENFTKLDFGLCKDLCYVYAFGRIISDDPNNFELVSYRGSFCCYRDSKNVYINHVRLGDADASTFQLLPFGYGRDQSGVYYLNSAQPRKIRGADPHSFQIINQYFGFDAQHVYRLGSLFIDFDTKTLNSLIKEPFN